jgi:hypothetical protein
VARKRKRRTKKSPAGKSGIRASAVARGRRPGNLSVGTLNGRSPASRDAALHVLAAMRRDPKLSFVHASKLEGVRPGTVKKYFGSALKKVKGQWRVSKSDRFIAVLYVPDAQGNPVPVTTRSSKEREQVSAYLRDVGRYLRGNSKALAKWRGRSISGVELVTDAHILEATEPALADFSMYRALNGGGV